MADYQSAYTGQEIDAGITAVKNKQDKLQAGQNINITNNTISVTGIPNFSPDFAESVEWLDSYGDTSKIYLLPDGYIYAYSLSTHPDYTNLFNPSTAILNKRVSSTGALKDANGYVITDFIDIPASYISDNSQPLTVRWRPGSLKFVDDSIGYATVSYWTQNESFVSYNIGPYHVAHNDANGDKGFYLLWSNNPSPEHAMATTDIAKFKLCFNLSYQTEITQEDIKDVIITLGEPIQDTTGYSWTKLVPYNSGDVTSLNLGIDNKTLALKNGNVEISSVELPIDSTEVTNPCDYKGNEIITFSKGVCIGDSITKGAFDTTNAIFEDTKYSYPTQLSKLTNITIENWGITGKTTVKWWEEKGSADFSGFDFAIVNLGINDVAKGTDISDSRTAFTNIINALKTANRGIKIFMATVIPGYADNTTSYDAINNVIKDLANNTENCYLVDLTRYSYTHKGTAYVNGHLTAIGYNRLARDYMAYISYIINQNKDDFKYIQYINTNY